MNDQANELRHWVRREGAESSLGGAQVWAVSGGRRGVGVTTVAVNLAVALAERGGNCLLVDADAEQAGATMMCGLEVEVGIGDVMAGRCGVELAVVAGPGGISVLPGVLGEAAQLCDAASLRRFCEQLGELAPGGFVVIDSGSGLGPTVQALWRAADLVLAVTTPDGLAVMDAYAAIKTHCLGRGASVVRTMVNRAIDARNTADIHHRLAGACQQFLKLNVAPAGHLPTFPRGRQAPHDAFVLSQPDATATHCMRQIVESLAGSPALA